MQRSGQESLIRNPARLVLLAFTALILLGTLLLFLPVSMDGPTGLGLEDALFTATSATTVTGLASVDITVFSLFGELVILALIQVGGFGIMAIGSVLGQLAGQRFGLRQRILAQAEIGTVDHGDLRALLRAMVRITFAAEGLLATVLFLRFWSGGYEDGVGDALYSAVFHGISTFNNAGIALYSDSMTRFVGDPFVILPVSVGFIVGGLGFPVWAALWQRRRTRITRRVKGRRLWPRHTPWSLHVKFTLVATAALLVVGPVLVLVFEWTNPLTLGPMNLGDKLLAAWFQGVSPRTAGYNSVPIGSLNEATLLVMTALMFIGAGAASTSGGIKVTTFAILACVLWSEVRGERDVNAFGRRLPTPVIRLAVTIALLSVGVTFTGSLVLMGTDGLSFTPALFEVASAFGTVGLSTGVAGTIGPSGHLLLVAMMLAGRVGLFTFVTALTLREGTRAFRYPEERPIVG